LIIEQKAKKYKLYSFLFSLLLHMFLFIFSIRALFSLQASLSKGKEIEVSLINIEKPRIILKAPLIPPNVRNLIENVQIKKTVIPIEKRIEIPKIKNTPKVVDVPSIKKVVIKKPVNIKKIDIDENAINKIPVPVNPEKFASSIHIKQSMKLVKTVKPVTVKASALPEIGQNSNNPISKSLYKELLARYSALLRKIIEKYKFYPELAREEGLEGEVLLEFKVLKNGNLAFIKVLKSSSYDILDSAAVFSVKKAAPFPPIPKKLGKKAITMRLWIKFELGG